MKKFTYLRLYGDEAGESHFEEVEIDLEPMDFAVRVDPIHLRELSDVSTLTVTSVADSWGGEDPHPTPARQFVVNLTGEIDLTASDGTTRRLGPGDLILLDDIGSKGHASRVLGDVTALMIRAPNGTEPPSA